MVPAGERDNRMTSKTINLSEPIKGHHGMIKSVVLREPKYSDFIDLGMPTCWVSLSEGGFSQETPSILGQWIERLADIDPNFLAQLCLRDTLALRGAVLSFFIEAALPLPTADDNQFLNSEQSSPSSLSATSGPSTI
jgi:Phage tail assembly chaperone proteins, E, or 41 or 14